MPTHPVDVRVLEVASNQCRLFSRAQALACGGDKSLIARRIESGQWDVPISGVYGIPGEPPSFHRMLWLALLSAPDGAVISHWSAANLHRLTGFPPTRATITVPHGAHHQNTVAVVHQTSAASPAASVQGLPATPLPRTFIDLAKVAGPRRIGRALEDAILDGKCTLEGVRKEFFRLARQGRTGIALMRDVLKERGPGSEVRRSELERRLDDILKTIPVAFKHEAPFPGREHFQQRVDRLTDIPRKLIIEGDGRKWHARVDDFTRDRQRDRRALAAGYPTARYCYWELVNDKHTVRSEIMGLLGL